MSDQFTIAVIVDDGEIEFEVRLILPGYIHRIEVVIDDIQVLFEPDEEINYRAFITAEQFEGKGRN